MLVLDFWWFNPALLPTGVFRNSAVGIYWFSDENESKVVVYIMRINEQKSK